MREHILERLKQSSQYLSGAVLSAELGISRAAVHKHIKKLKEMGYVIDSVPNKGYRLAESAVLSIYELKAMLDEDACKLTPYFFESIDSTNNFAKQLEEPSLIVALEQTAGRGRRGRAWLSQKGQGIYFSLLLKPTLALDRLSAVTQLCGLAVARAIGARAQIKWPNDIYIGGRKVCGILSELQSEELSDPRLILGIGINLSTTAMEGATDLQTEQYSRTPKSIIRQFLKEFFVLYSTFIEVQDLSFVRQEIDNRSFLLSKEVTVSDSTEIYVFSGIGDDGAALLAGEHPRSLHYGEVSVRAHEG